MPRLVHGIKVQVDANIPDVTKDTGVVLPVPMVFKHLSERRY